MQSRAVITFGQGIEKTQTPPPNPAGKLANCCRNRRLRKSIEAEKSDARNMDARNTNARIAAGVEYGWLPDLGSNQGPAD